jgi:predicted NBD/HSP70 family sugar kinase
LPALSDDDELWVHAADAIAQLCANLVLTVSPERIVLGGGVMQRTCLYDMVRVSALKNRADFAGDFWTLTADFVFFSATCHCHANRIAHKRS